MVIPGENRKSSFTPLMLMPRSVSANQQTPLHAKISEQLREQVLLGEFAPGDQLPSEHQLMELFGVSRITVRRAIANLVSQGLVEAQQGKGVFVKEQRKVFYRLSNPMVFLEEDMARQGVSYGIENLVLEQMTAPSEVCQALQLEPTAADVYFQKKLFLLDGAPVAIDITYTIAEVVPLGNELASRMTFPLLEQWGVPIERIETTLECTHADPTTAHYLNISLGSPILVYRYVAYTANNRPVVCGESLSRGDRLCYSVVLTKSHF